MDIINTLSPTVKLELLSQKAGDIIARLQKAGLFRAIVIEQQGKQVLLDTAFGQIKGRAAANLNKGDEIVARLNNRQSDPVIDIVQHKTKSILLNTPATKKLLPLVTQQPVVAQVTQRSDSTQLKIGENNIILNKQNVLQNGETIILKRMNRETIEVTRLKPETLLKNALTQLLPRQLPPSPVNNLAYLQNIVTDLNQSRLLNLEQRLIAKQNEGTFNRMSQINPNSNPSKIMQDAISQGNKRVDEKSLADSQHAITQLLTKIAKPLARVENFNAQAVQHILTLLTLLKPGKAPIQDLTVKNLPESLRSLMFELKNSPEAFKLLVTKLLSQAQSSANQTMPQERQILEMSQFLRSELIQQSEQSLNQLLTQKAAIKLQSETQQPLQMHLNIPLQVDHEARNVELKIREKQRQEQSVEPHWEIDLTFEFGLLGPISAHILLQAHKLSAHFWAMKPKTKILIEDHMDQFKHQLHKSGFELGLFNCYQGSPPEAESNPPVSLSENLLDIQA